MQIRIPRVVTRVVGPVIDFLNVPIWWRLRRGRIVEVRRVDVLLVLGFIACVSWYWHTMGWQGALMGASAYIFAAMAALWISL